MRGHPSFERTKERTSAVEDAAQKYAEECECRLAKRFNTPKEKINTPWSPPTNDEIRERLGTNDGPIGNTD